MTFTNLRSLLVASLNKTWKQEQILSSIIWKSIVEDFQEIKKIDLNPYIVSVKINKNIITVKTLKPIINTELSNIEWQLRENISMRLKKIWVNIVNIQLKFK